ncbi:MAG TPA: RNA polymerase sigma factor [Polyangia bacterium]|nr:RNA polymerase sigma factor [Polyangia bacterium]
MIVVGIDLGDAFRRHRGALAATAVRVLRRPEDVDDVLQDVFVEALRGVHALREPTALRAWLTRVTVRAAQRRRAGARFVGRFVARSESLEDAAAHVADPRASALDLALLAAIGEVMAGIPAERRRAWALRTVDGEPIDDIAVRCGCSATTVKRRIAEVQGLLEAALGDEPRS